MTTGTDVSRRHFLVGSVAGVIAAAKPVASQQTTRASAGDFGKVKALVFDTFGTVVDWRGSVSAQVADFAKRKTLHIDADEFADAWRSKYQPYMDKVRKATLPWTKLDELHRLMLDDVIDEFGLKGKVSDVELADLNRVWHRLKPWPDSVSGLTRLKKKFIIAPLSNGNISLMTELAKYAGLPWDCILGAELVRHYKTDHEVYESAAYFLDLKRDEVMMVAAHLGDLTAAKAVGLRTAFVVRPVEFGPSGKSPAGKADLEPNGSVDLPVKDFNELATKLGA
jgi:2-haloacid dehalogenase